MACSCLCNSAAQQQLDQTRDYEGTAVSNSLELYLGTALVGGVHFGFRLSSSAVAAHSNTNMRL